MRATGLVACAAFFCVCERRASDAFDSGRSAHSRCFNLELIRTRTMKSKFIHLGLALLACATNLLAATHVWSGAGGNSLFSNPANWSSGGVPSSNTVGLAIVFPTNGSASATVDIQNLRVQKLSIERANFSLMGSPSGIKLKLVAPSGNSSVITSIVAYAQVLASVEFELNGPCRLVLPREVSCEYDIVLKEDVCTMSPAGRLRLANRLSGPGSIIVDGGWDAFQGDALPRGIVEFAGSLSNTYSGITFVRNGATLELNKDEQIAVPRGLEIEGRWVETSQDIPGGDIVTETMKGGRVVLRQTNGIAADMTVTNAGTMELFGGDAAIGDMFFDGGVVETGTNTLYLTGNVATRRQVYGSSVDQSAVFNGRLHLGSGAGRIPPRVFDVINGECVVNARIFGGATATLVKQGEGDLVLNGTNSYSGPTVLEAGGVLVKTPGALGLSSGETIVGPEAQLRLEPNVSISEPVVLNGRTNEFGPAQLVAREVLGGIITQVYEDATNTLNGPVTISGLVTVRGQNGHPHFRFAGALLGTGTLRLNDYSYEILGAATNSFSGTLLFEGGTLDLRKPSGVPAFSGPLIVGDPYYQPALDSDRPQVRLFASNQLPDNQSIYLRPTVVLNLGTNNDVVGPLFLDAADVRGSNRSTLSITAPVTVTFSTNAAVVSRIDSSVVLAGQSAREFNVASGARLDLVGAVSGGPFATLLKTGEGRLRLLSSNSFFGMTHVEEGVVLAGHTAALGDTFGNTVVEPGSHLELVSGLAFRAEPLSLDGTLSGGSNFWPGPITLLNNGVVSTHGTIVVTNVISGGGTLTKFGTGTLELSGPAMNTFAGNTVVGGGTLRLNRRLGANGIAAIPGGTLIIGTNHPAASTPSVELLTSGQITDATAVFMRSNATFTANGFNVNFGSLNGAGTIALGAGTLTVGALNTDSTFSGSITGNGVTSLRKSGSGTLTLYGGNPFTGATLHQSGTLIVFGTLSSSTLQMEDGAVLSGRGLIGPIAGTGGTASPGANPGVSAGTLNCGSLLWTPQHLYRAELNGTVPGISHDQLNVAGTVNLGGAALDVKLGFAGAVSNEFVIINNDGSDAVVGTFAGLPEGATLSVKGAPFRISYVGGSGNDVTLTQLAAGTPPKGSGLTKLPNGHMQIGGEGLAGQLYQVQATTHLSAPSWVVIGEATANVAGTFSFTDTNAPSFPTRFYRFVAP
jgi:autotransporter-associated beta strand protein